MSPHELVAQSFRCAIPLSMTDDSILDSQKLIRSFLKIVTTVMSTETLSPSPN